MMIPIPRLTGAAAAALAGLMALSGSALADAENDYRVLGCDQAEDASPVPGDPAEFVVVSSFVPEEIGQPCETVMTTLGSQGFRLIDVVVRSEFFGGGIQNVGVLHYLERSDDD